MLLPGSPAQATGSPETVAGLTYVGDSTTFTATVTGYVGSDTELDIPSSVELSDNKTYIVTSIGFGAFANKGLISATIPNSVTTIGDSAFQWNQLTSVTIPDSVTTIGVAAFLYNNLASVTIPDSVTTLGQQAFQNNRLTSVTIPSSITTIGLKTFSNNELATVTIPDSITTIGGGAFEMNNLTSVTLPDSVTALEQSAFSSNKLTSVTIPSSVATIGNYAFTHNLLTSVTISGPVTAFGVGSFANNPNLTEVVFEDAAPSTFTPGLSSGPFKHIGSLGIVSSDLTVYYLKQFESSGFASPTWQNYQSQARVIVSFDSTGASAIPSITVDAGNPATEPAAPTRTGHTFTGWYTDAATTTAYDFTTNITDDLTLYAGWEAIRYNVTFDTGSGASAIPSITVDAGNPVAEPAAPTRTGHTFTGWYTDAATTTAYDFTTNVTDDLTLYAGWKLIPADPVTPTDGDTSKSGELADTGGPNGEAAAMTGVFALLAGLGLVLARRRAKRVAR